MATMEQILREAVSALGRSHLGRERHNYTREGSLVYTVELLGDQYSGAFLHLVAPPEEEGVRNVRVCLGPWDELYGEGGLDYELMEGRAYGSGVNLSGAISSRLQAGNCLEELPIDQHSNVTLSKVDKLGLIPDGAWAAVRGGELWGIGNDQAQVIAAAMERHADAGGGIVAGMFPLGKYMLVRPIPSKLLQEGTHYRIPEER